MGQILNFWWIPLVWVIGAAVLWVATWIVYLANMAVLWAGARPVGTAARLAAWVPRLAAVMSTSMNWAVFTVILLEWPRERFLSTRLARHVRTGHGWRWRVACQVGRVWLDPFDPAGTHVGASHHA